MNLMDAIICDTASSLPLAFEALQSSDVLILDSEGKDLGIQSGSLSIVTLHIPTSQKTYLFDVLNLSTSDLRPMYNLLESPSVTKVVFDGRMDYSALYHEKSVAMQNVVDMQIADVRSRVLRGEGRDEQMERLKGYIHEPELRGTPSKYWSVQRLNGLSYCAKEHKIDIDGFPEINIEHTAWMTRPLPEKYTQYATIDAKLINAVYDEFNRLEYIDDILRQQSMRYVTMWKDHQPSYGDTYHAHALLPLGVLDNPTYFVRRACNTCHRELPQEAFSKTGWRLGKNLVCWVCAALKFRKRSRSHWDTDDEYEYYDSDEIFGWSAYDSD